jgi:hypothetical protein
MGFPPKDLERQGAPDEMQAWFQAVRTRHAFAKMSKEEILEILRQTREAVWTEQHAS